MAKKKAKAKPHALQATGLGAWIVSNGYTLTMENSQTSFIFQLDVQDPNANPYYLRVANFNESVGTVQKALRVIADRWPSFAFEFQANTDGSIKDVR